jgi:ATP-binding cassette subfamily B multidrug efflux pump
MKPLIRIREFFRPYSWQVALASIFLLVITIANLVIPEIIRQVIDIGLVGGEKRFLLNAAFVVLGIGLLIAVIDFVDRYLSSWIAYRVTFDLRNRLYNHIQHLSFSYHDHTQTGQLISRCIEDVRSIQEFTGTGFFELMRIILLLVGVVVLLFVDNARLAAIALIPMIPLFFTTTHFGSRVGELFYHVDQALGELSARLQENVGGAQVVRAFAREPYEIQRFDERNRRLYEARISVIQEWSRVMPTSHFLIAMSTVLILWFGGNMVLRGEMTLGEVVAFNTYLLLMAEPARQLVMLVNTAGEASAGIKRIFEVLEQEPEIQSPPNAIKLPALSGLVEFRDVCFQYQGESEVALENITLRVEPNQVVALIGPTGSGKTSLVNLIPRFYEVTQGAVLVDGMDIRQVELPSLRKQIGIVLQTSLLFSDSVRANIAYGRPDASLDEIVEVSKAAQAHDFITAMSDGYDTEIGERGITLSGGQRQRIAIARALLLDPRILILDDSTSSVDTQTERLIQKALNRLMEGRTTFIIAQRLSSVRRADLIVVLDNGRIIERGTHDTLLAQGGLYREIYDLQLRGQEKGIENGIASPL